MGPDADRTFTTGIKDAVGYLGLDKVFTGNMTGNVVVLGMGLVRGTDLPVLGPALALLGFMAGAAAGGRALREESRAWTRPGCSSARRDGDARPQPDQPDAQHV